MKHPIWPWLGILVATAAPAATLTLTPVKDNTLYESASGSLSNGSGQSFFVGRTRGGERRRALLAFDLSSVPAGAQLSRVALTLTLTMANSSSRTPTLVLRRVSTAWGEGSSNAGDPGGSGAAAVAGDATWLHTVASTAFWTRPGGDFSDTLSASQSVAGAGSYTWESAQLLADAQDWIASPADNHGWILLGEESATGTAKRFASRETPTPAQRPKLTIEYTLPNTPPTAGSLPDLHLALSGGGTAIDPAAAPALFRDADGDSLRYSALSADTSKVAVALTGNTLVLVPRGPGTVTVTLSAEDGRGGSASLSFAVQVNTPPALAAIPDQAVDENGVSGPIAVEIGDVETPADSLTLSVRSDNDLLLPPAGIALTGSGANRRLTLTPATGQSGSARLTLTLGDGSDSTSQSFSLEVNPVVVQLIGDFDGDLVVGFDDFFLFADHFGETTSSPGWNALYDLDVNSGIDFDDFFLFADHFGEEGAP